MTEDKKSRVTDRATGEGKFADNAPVKRQLGDKVELGEQALDVNVNIAPSSAVTSVSGPDLNATGMRVDASPSVASGDAGRSSLSIDKPKSKSEKKKKAEIETIEQFILQAYSLKGRKVVLSDAVERRIGRQPTMDAAAVDRILTKSRGDLLFAVPRQLLLIARDIQTYPTLRGAIREIVKTVLLAHPLFSDPQIVAAIKNLPEAPSMIDVMRTLACSELPPELRSAGKPVIKAPRFAELRINAVYCLAVWFHETRGLSVSELNDALFRALWSQSAVKLSDERAKLRAVTELRDIAAAGVACSEFRSAATERLRQLNAIQQEASQAQVEVATQRAEIEQLRATQELRVAQLVSQVQDLEALAEKYRTESDNELTHLRDDLERQRTRVLRRLKADINLLDEGLIAIRREPPKIPVMEDHSERVADSLRQEIKKLESGG